ncbi:exosome complex exonuclease Rrp6 [Hamiltosporidium tvaerminnensis]|uniref:Exosome complex exonuclease Rrp6 n=1 Tax=Hamiltosporidium tvaerminnensis TaxID=1176355 RepID=A0A4Q9L7F7_9MICR|nr:hypothetical protein LUQ84_3448 [Hamiltosporidium tvaerminnensis]TBU03587.1 exosome complex exonuclease Rrp6 [Hamiltosporidium tvaerminnensis]TBU17666.1 exosome complex exonuclease Rrp6 [Hamiltosporidium tvaerminnensis]
MKEILEKCTELIRAVNSTIARTNRYQMNDSSLNENNSIAESITKISELLNKFDENFFDKTTARIDHILCNLNKQPVHSKIIKIIKDKKVIFYFGDGNAKPLNVEFPILNLNCTHLLKKSDFLELENNFYFKTWFSKSKGKQFVPTTEFLHVNYTPIFINSSAQISFIEEAIKSEKIICVDVKQHTFRSFRGYTTYLLLLSPSHSFIIDAVTLQYEIPKLSFLNCSIKKIVPNTNCLEILKRDFNLEMGCVYNLEKDNNYRSVIVDWRINPLTEELYDFAFEKIFNSIIKIKEDLSENDCEGRSSFRITPITEEGIDMATINNLTPIKTGISEIDEKELARIFSRKYNFYNDGELLGKILKLRYFIAKSEDESLQFVMTDEQVQNVVVNKPSNIEQFFSCFDRISPLVRIHISDFLLTIKEKKSGFDIDKLKSLKTNENTDLETKEFMNSKTKISDSSNNFGPETKKTCFDLQDSQNRDCNNIKSDEDFSINSSNLDGNLDKELNTFKISNDDLTSQNNYSLNMNESTQQMSLDVKKSNFSEVIAGLNINEQSIETEIQNESALSSANRVSKKEKKNGTKNTKEKPKKPNPVSSKDNLNTQKSSKNISSETLPVNKSPSNTINNSDKSKHDKVTDQNSNIYKNSKVKNNKISTVDPKKSTVSQNSTRKQPTAPKNSKFKNNHLIFADSDDKKEISTDKIQNKNLKDIPQSTATSNKNDIKDEKILKSKIENKKTNNKKKPNNKSKNDVSDKKCKNLNKTKNNKNKSVDDKDKEKMSKNEKEDVKKQKDENPFDSLKNILDRNI